MQQRKTEQRQTSVRLPRQLPANLINETTSPFSHIKSAPHQSNEKATLTTDLNDLDTQRSLSSCPTYLSLSRNSPETRECATQITTEDPFDDYSLPSDNNPSFLLQNEIGFMPISSRFSHYPEYNPTIKPRHITRPQIVARSEKFREKNQNGFQSNSKNKPNPNLPPRPRPTAVKQQSPRSDTFLVSPKRNNDTIPKQSPKRQQLPPSTHNSRRDKPHTRASSPEFTQNSRRQKLSVRNSPSPPMERRRAEPIRRSVPKHLSSPTESQDLGRKPVRFTNAHNNSYPKPRPPPPPPPSSFTQDTSDRSRRMRVANQDYIVQRRAQTSDPIHDDYRREIPRRSQRVVRVAHDDPYEEDDDVYYVEPPRRTTIRRQSPQTEYVYVNERARHRPEVVYVDEEQPIEYEDEYIYVDQHGNEVDIADDRRHSPRYVEYVYEDEIDSRRRHTRPKVVYMDDDIPRKNKKYKQPSNTRIIYE